MNWSYLILILAATIGGGVIPMTVKRLHPNLPIYLLAFTGAFLFGITIMHLLPEVYHELGHTAGIYIVLGFFLQVFLQQLSHGMEHGHTHLPPGTPAHGHHHHFPITPLLAGLSIHAFMEGIPLGLRFEDQSALPSLALGIAAHKVPEALTLITVMTHTHQPRAALWRILALFSLVTPVAAVLAGLLGTRSTAVTASLIYLTALVIGAFIHISTTIFYESGTRHHEMSRQKVLAFAAGIVLAFLTLIFE